MGIKKSRSELPSTLQQSFTLGCCAVVVTAASVVASNVDAAVGFGKFSSSSSSSSASHRLVSREYVSRM